MDNNENTSQFRFCIKCGAPLVQGARFCPKCGAAIVRKTAAEAPAYTVIPAEAPAYTEIPADDVAAAENASAGGNDIPGIINESAGTDGSVKAELEGGIENAGAASDTADIAGEPAAAETPRTARQSVDDEFIKQMRAFEASRREQEQARRARAAAPVTREVPKEEKKRGVPGWLMAVVVVAAVLVTALFTGVVVAKIASNSQTDKASIEKIVEDYIRNNPSLSGQSGTKPGGDTSIGGETVPGGSQVTINIDGDSTSVASAVYAKCAQSVVGVGIYGRTSANPWTQSSSELVSSGSGVVYRSDGYIITNHHVIDDAIDDNNKIISGYEIRVYTDDTLGSYYVASVVGADATSDLALIKIEETGLVPIEFEDIENVSIGDMVFSIGCPGGLEFMGTLSSGVVGGINKNLLTEDGYAFDLILTDAAINPGISGGALVNANGKLVGICELKIIETNFESMGFAISTDTVRKISEALYKEGKVVRPALGVAVNTNYGPQEANESGAPAGAWISEVTKGSAAEKAGIKVNMIITEVNGVAVYDYVSLRAQLLKYTVGEKVEIKAYVYSGSDVKNGTYKIFTVTLQVLEDN